MSPVSRGRKAKKGRKARAKNSRSRAISFPARAELGSEPSDSGLSFLDPSAFRPDDFDVLDFIDEPEPPELPGWVDESVDRILGGADITLAARGPRQLEQAIAELVGAELSRADLEELFPLAFEVLLEEVAQDAGAAVREESGRPGGAWEGPWRLLNGLTSILMPGPVSAVREELALARQALPAGAAAAQPDWLKLLPKIAPTGQVWEMHDAYPTRFAVIAGFSYPGGVDQSVFLFDIDACGGIVLAGGGVFDDVDQAAAAWREPLGEAAAQARPTLVESAERLYCLAYMEIDEFVLTGSEPRALMNNWFRAARRSWDLAQALRKRRMPLPDTPSLYHDFDPAPMAEEFTGWYEQRHSQAPDPDAVAAVAAEWCEGALPGTWHAASPHRATYQLTLISDWISHEPVTVAAKRLLPEWVRWNGEHSGLPEHLIERAVAAASVLRDEEPSPADG